jgi:hypothetical protein
MSTLGALKLALEGWPPALGGLRPAVPGPPSRPRG